MHVTHLSLVDFRSYSSVELELEQGVTVLVGPNGHGKTNLVEAVNYVATLGSHRVASDAPLVRVGADRAVVRTAIQRAERSTLVELEITPGRANRARVNRSPVPRVREVLGLLRTVVFAPEDLSTVKGDPSERRRFLDELLVARVPRLAGVRADYDRVLKQRNALLKSAGAARRAGGRLDVGTLDVWDAHLADTGAELLAARLELVGLLRPLVDKAYAQVSSGPPTDAFGSTKPTSIDYASSLGPDAPLDPDRAVLASALLDAMSGRRREEIERGVSLVGPHRDDLVLRLGPTVAKGYASHGESWSYALALRLASFDLLRQDGGEPVLILDDVFAELDTHRRLRLAEIVASGTQVLVTAAVPDDVPEQLSGARVDVLAGDVRRAG